MISQETDYPVSVSIRINISESKYKYIAVRIPAWCSKFKISKPYKLEKGYAYIECGEKDQIVVEFNMPVYLIEANERVRDCAGKVAVARGPVVYCIEEKDNGKHIKNLFLDKDAKFVLNKSEEFSLLSITTPGYRKVSGNSLYNTVIGSYQKTYITLIPYYAFANRDKSEMVVWVGKKF